MPLDVAIERAQHSGMRMHQRPPIFRRHDQGLGRGLPHRALLFGSRQCGDVTASMGTLEKRRPSQPRVPEIWIQRERGLSSRKAYL
jgi:hypothetical protein